MITIFAWYKCTREGYAIAHTVWIFCLQSRFWATSILGQFFLDGQFYLSEIDEFATLNVYFILRAKTGARREEEGGISWPTPFP